MKPFGEYLRNLRLEQKLSGNQMYRIAGVHRGSLSKYETGISYPSIPTILVLAKAYKVKPESIFTRLKKELI